MKRLAFPPKKQVDEWNPHIVRHFRDQVPELPYTNYDLLKHITEFSGFSEEAKKDFGLILGEDKVDVLRDRFEEWMRTWKSAQTILNEVRKDNRRNKIYPLAYRLEPTLSKPLEVDPIEGSKFGGVPDFRHEYSFRHPEGREASELISSLWPRCGDCGDHMRFLAGVDLSDWLLPIHFMTANQPTHTNYGSKITDSNLHYNQHSGLGFGKNLCADSWPLYKPFFQIFYCQEPHSNSPVFDAMLHFEKRNSRRERLLDISTYKEAISQFVADKKIESNIPLQTLEGLALRFDIDIPGEEFIEGWMKKLKEKHPEVFGKSRKDTPYQFFGHPYSQQTERRPACQNTFLGLHRMAPIVNWNDPERDFSYQIYGCLRCVDETEERVYCKTDGSCT